ncbi:stage III sporulation protein AE [Salibacterium halotolerans]|uniref:Stage III sporulation protein AE n=1 Tax=Salibacterium halotolerans TaxID=1884432 RepID=A0A1I5NN82_9BACI|nr:stage III sporulation protein AE [Salibacterium halotolerans]SFP23192.1 stage III sporulation protein AE [Salibacterium halotolerans]
MKAQAALLVCLIVSLFLYTDSTTAVTGIEEGREEIQDMKEDQIENVNISEIRKYWENIEGEYGAFLPESQKGSLKEFITGEKQFAPKEWGMAFLQYIFHEVTANGKLMGTLLILAVFSAVLKAVQNAFETEVVNKAAYAVVFLVFIVIALNSFYLAMDYVKDTVGSMVHFMIALLPLMLALLATSGAAASSALFHPLVVFLVQSSGMLIENIILPLLFFSAILSVVSSLNEHIKLTKLAELLRRTAMGILAVFFTIFLGVISVQGATTAVTDGVAIRTAKFIAGNFVPVIGRVFTDAADTALGASVLLKNTVGLAGLAILFLLCAFPAIKVLVISFIFHFTAALVQPLGDGPLLEALSVLGKTVLSMFAALAAVSFMFFLALTLIVVSGNISLMVR